MSGGGGSGGGSQKGGDKPFGLSRDAFDAQKPFLEALTNQTALTYDKLQDILLVDTCKREALKKLTEKVTDIQQLIKTRGATIEITITRK